MSQAAPGYNIEQVLINEANRIGPDIYRKTLNTSPWLKLVKKDAWPDEMGDTVRVLTYERSLPTNNLVWSQISVNPVISRDGTYSNNTSAVPNNTSQVLTNQLPSAQRIEFAQTLRSYNLTHTALESPKLSVNDLRFSLRRKEQLANIFAILQENTSYAWQERYRDEYVRLAQNKINATSSALTSVTGETPTFSGTVPNLPLTQGMLDRAYMKLIRDGGGNNPLDRENARPVFGVILSSEASRNLIATSADIRQDYRYSDSKNELLAPLGISRSYGGFFHLVDDWLPRHDEITVTSASAGAASLSGTFTGTNALQVGDQLSGPGIAHGTFVTSLTSTTGVGLSTPTIGTTGTKIYVRRMPYKAVATTQGNKFDINPAYEAAKFEDSIVFHQDVFNCLVPKPITSAGSNVTFDAVSYMGDFKWKNIPHATDNPDGTIGYFRAILSCGSKPVRPEWGTVIRALRSSTFLDLTTANNPVYA
jgi:hypothetical protein